MKESIVHIKLDYPEAIESKTDLLELEMTNLNSQKFLKRYIEIRKDELKSRLKLQQKISQILADMKKLKEQFPSSQLPETIRKRKAEIRKEVEERETYSKYIEFELEKIKDKLKSLQNK